MTVPAHCIEHRRGDGERVGWMVPTGDLFVAVDLLGRTRTEPVEWLMGEEALDELGIGYLADPYELLLDGAWRRVRIREVSPESIRVAREDWGDMTVPLIEHVLPFPMPDTLRPQAG
jgi:hypothetical protein